ncbi:MAG: hypothetical protein JWN53_949 [Gemmatimonadetes bacterium]|nr:hypothetical protein [Gemmatimonadota bacterium]
MRHTTAFRTGLGSLVSLAFTVVVAACGADSATSPATTSTCPAASSRSALGGASFSSTLAPGGPAYVTGGCDHRARIDIPLAHVIDLNDNGAVLGINASGQYVVWTRTGTTVLATPPGATGISAVDFNNNGQVVGCAYYNDVIIISAVPANGPPSPLGRCHAVIWDAQGNATDLGTFGITGAVEARPTAINDAGVIVGDIVLDNGNHRAFVRLPNGNVTLITTPGTQSGAVAINENGDVTGWYTSGSAQYGPFSAFTWSATGGFVDIGTVPTSVAGAVPSLMPTSIDANGDIVGTVYAYTASNPQNQQRSSAFLYEKTKGVRDLTALSGLTEAVNVTAQGEILGWATVDGVQQPVTWSESRNSQLGVRYGWTYSAAQGVGAAYANNSWNEVLDSFNEAGVLHNVVWTWNPERYR